MKKTKLANIKRLATKGYEQEFGVDYKEVFTPVARHDTIRLVMAAQNSWFIFQLDVKSAFLHGDLQEKVFAKQPPGYVKLECENKVYKLKTTLYGLKQAPRAWYSRIEAYFLHEGFQKCPYEHTLFVKLGGDGKMLIVRLDYAGDIDDRKNTSGYVFMLSLGAISWSSKKQSIFTLSTTEAEFIAATSYVCQAIWLKKILEELQFKQEGSIAIYCDNSSVIKLSKNPVLHGRSKHMDVKFHFLRDLTKDGTIDVFYCKSEDQIANIMTKPLKLSMFQKFRKLMGVAHWMNLMGGDVSFLHSEIVDIILVIGCPILFVCSRIGYLILVWYKMPFVCCVFWYWKMRVMHNGIDGEFAVALRLLRIAATQQKSVVNASDGEGTKM
ncbi:Integrase, catalytic core [Cucumis melo var. makuwa]|uniref:Integrase, catalytic core n=1 Tax=Cucumis melo var. makuwa TaxID=1194695 RepID=A0A5D3BSY4_CUCMM|nr:Integrase, catalytic core [Cucumis melo var. makuwa]